MLPLPVNSEVRDAGAELRDPEPVEPTATNFYGSGYHFGRGGNIEGSSPRTGPTGDMVWVEDCHGDTYSVFPAGDAVYSASHKHYCGNIRRLPADRRRGRYHRATATTKTAGASTPRTVRLPRPPRPAVARASSNWYPDINAGTYTGKGQGPWTVTGNASTCSTAASSPG